MCSTVNAALPFSFSCEGSVNTRRLHGEVSMSTAHRFNASGRFRPNYSTQPSDMDLAWQEIMAITELQEFEVPGESSFEAVPYHSEHYGSFGMTLAEANPPGCQASPAAFDGGYTDAMTSYQRLNPHVEMHYNVSQASSRFPAHGPPLQHSLINLLDPMSLNTSTASNKNCNGLQAEDLESDSGLSLGSSPPLASPENAVQGSSSTLPQNSSLGYPEGDMECIQEPYQIRPADYSTGFSSYPGQSYFPAAPDHHHMPHSPHIPNMKHLVPAPLHGNSTSTLRAPPFQAPLPKSRAGSSTGPLTRDERRALALQIPFPLDKIINLPVDDFNELLSRHTLNDAQLTLVRDIRRRGKNKVAAQNCRKRKLENIVHLEHELTQLRVRREHLARERLEFQQNLGLLKCRLSELYAQVFSQLRDEDGHPYSLEDYSLQQTTDGSVYLVQRNASQAGEMN